MRLHGQSYIIDQTIAAAVDIIFQHCIAAGRIIIGVSVVMIKMVRRVKTFHLERSNFY